MHPPATRERRLYREAVSTASTSDQDGLDPEPTQIGSVLIKFIRINLFYTEFPARLERLDLGF
ncbi:hypothetical protein GCM10008938_50850 [Deinococcus roseus]|uniref:Uncharacterized protein n=1 Tax=Deinococcus roseus TaxID=392414 RepID=A0ABQ2DL56_9DEIO|nr:hypothetical protein GCM10008938_50850 [Deinococcus roseus]